MGQDGADSKQAAREDTDAARWPTGCWKAAREDDKCLRMTF